MIPESTIIKIASEAGTPVYIYDEVLLKKTASAVFKNFRRMRPHYSLKANPNTEICRVMRSAGFGAEAASEFEARFALEAGFSPENIMYDGPAKTSREIREALNSGISHFNVESGCEAGRIAEEAGRSDNLSICLRVNPAKASSAGEIMTGQSSRFGIDEEILHEEARGIKNAGIKINGVHLYVGSQILDSAKIETNFDAGLEILSSLCRANLTDANSPYIFTFGPGIGVPYGGTETGQDYGSCAPGMLESAERFRKRHGSLIVKTEIGRALTARAGIYATRVVETKMSRGRLYVLVDGGIHHFMRYALTGAVHRAVLAGGRAGPRQTAVIGGATCTPYDVLTVAEIEIPRPGDIVAVLDAGAYGWSMGMSHFLSRPSPAEIMAGENEWRIIRKPGSIEDFAEH